MPDRIRTIQSAPAVVEEMIFRFGPGDRVFAFVTASTTYADGGTFTATHEVELPAGTMKTQVLALRTGQALSFWKTQEGL